MNVEERLRQFIVLNFMFDGDGAGLAEDTSLLEAGIIDSTGVLELVMFLSEEYGLEVPAEDIVPAHFDSVAGLAGYVRGRLAEGEQATERPSRLEA